MTEHERALAALSAMEAKASAARILSGTGQTAGEIVRTDAPRAYAALRATLEIHWSRGDYCNQCGDNAPCSTVRAIASALEGNRG